MATQILNHQLSKEAEALFEEVIRGLQNTVCFHPVADLGERGSDCYGALDFSSHDAYHIWLSTKLYGDVFEANMFHELHHIQQIEQGYPGVYNKEVPVFQSEESLFFEQLGRHLQSIILDLDVWNWVVKHGMQIRYFTKRYYQGAKATIRIHYDRLNDRFNFANYVCAFILFFSHATELQRNEILRDAQYNPDAVSFAASLSDEIRQIGYSDPLSTAKCMGLLLNKMDLWDTYSIGFNGVFLHTHEEFDSYMQHITKS